MKTVRSRLPSYAAVYVTLLAGSLIVVLTRAHHSGLGGPLNISHLFAAASSIQMFDARTGWAMIDKNQIIHTSDGGVHWKNVTPGYPGSTTGQTLVADFLTASSA